jgi:hypothetical protein
MVKSTHAGVLLFNAPSCAADKTAEVGEYCAEPLDIEPVQSCVYTSSGSNLQKSFLWYPYDNFTVLESLTCPPSPGKSSLLWGKRWKDGKEVDGGVWRQTARGREMSGASRNSRCYSSRRSEMISSRKICSRNGQGPTTSITHSISYTINNYHISIFWIKTPCYNFVGTYQRFEWTYCPYLHGWIEPSM